VLTGLPVAGFDGTLAPRYRTGPALPAAGRVRAKTGTLNAVSALAGLVRTADGRLLAFDLTTNSVPLGANRRAERALDALAARLAACGCP
jgi:D-alanyl-D-alanine carboxypeptidase/D-alanyl-D-alanine-endopeptidase (penicillin-binding protein 4)